jgi:class 3 adenylate cyclase
MMENYRYLLTWIVRLNSLLNDGAGAAHLFILGFICSPLLFYAIQPLFKVFILKKGGNGTLYEKNRTGASVAVLCLCAGIGIGLLPISWIWPALSGYLLQSLSLMAIEIFLFLSFYLTLRGEKMPKKIFIPLAAAGFLAALFPMAVNVPSSLFLGGFPLFLALLLPLFVLKKPRRYEDFRALLISEGELILMALSFFVPLTELDILLWAAPVLFFLARAERFFPAAVFIPEAESGERPEIAEPEMAEVVESVAALDDENQLSSENFGQVTRKMNPFVPREFLNILNKESVMDLKLGDHVMQEMTIFFSDIRRFTELFEGLSPEDSFKFINSYLTRIVPVIEAHGGFVDKYIGDAILALYPQENGADMAVRTAIEIQRKILEYNTHRAKCGYRPLEIGIGLHTGNLMLGVVGVHNRMQNTVISDSVNLASRVESLTKAFNVSMAISGQTFQKLEHPESYMFRYLGNVKVKGKGEPTRVYEILDGINPEIMERKMRANRFFEEGIFSYSKKNYLEALNSFNKVLEILPNDGASIAYMQNCITKIDNHTAEREPTARRGINSSS